MLHSEDLLKDVLNKKLSSATDSQIKEALVSRGANKQEIIGYLNILKKYFDIEKDILILKGRASTPLKLLLKATFLSILVVFLISWRNNESFYESIRIGYWIPFIVLVLMIFIGALVTKQHQPHKPILFDRNKRKVFVNNSEYDFSNIKLIDLDYRWRGTMPYNTFRSYYIRLNLKDGNSFTIGNSRFIGEQRVKGKLIAGLIGVSFDDGGWFKYRGVGI